MRNFTWNRSPIKNLPDRFFCSSPLWRDIFKS